MAALCVTRGTPGHGQKDKSNLSQDLKTNRQVYQRGIGVHAPCELMYDETRVQAICRTGWTGRKSGEHHNGSNLAKYPSVIFKAFIDDKQAAAGPVMRILSLAWRFNIEIRDGAKIIILVAMDAGDGSRKDFANWANAGFIVNHE